MNTDINLGVIIPAGGSGHRFGGNIPKQYFPIDGVPSIIRTVRTALMLLGCRTVVIAAAQDQHDVLRGLFAEYHVVDERLHIVTGGHERTTSVASALTHESLLHVEIIAIHDAVRPLASQELWERVVLAAQTHGCVIPTLPVVDTLKRVDQDVVTETIDRASVRRVQTPQAFQAELIRSAYNDAIASKWYGTDCASLCERKGLVVHCVLGEEHNIKITRPFDVVVAEAFLARN